MLSIGEMSRICGVTVKTLRHYDKIGLLKPECVGGGNGYRYYGEGQIGRMLLIGRYKRYGFSLPEIRELMELAEGELLARRLRQQKLRLEQQNDRTSLILGEMERHIRDFERTGDIMSYQKEYQVTVETCGELALLTERQVMSVEEFGTYYSRIYEAIARKRLKTTGVVLAIYHDKEFDPGASDIELGVGIEEQKEASRILKSRLCAVTTHTGPYSALPDAYGAVVAWMKANGWKMAGEPFEIYLKNQFDRLPPQEWVTKIYFPAEQ